MGDAVHGRGLHFDSLDVNRLSILLLRIAAGMCLAAFPVRAAQAQVGTGANLGTINLAAAADPTLRVVITTGRTQTIASVVDGVPNNFPTPVQIQTQWNLHPGSSNAVAVVAYFTNPARAMASGTNYIPSAWIRGRVATGTPTAYTPITQAAVVAGGQTVGTAGGSLLLFTQPISGKTKAGTRTDNLELQLDLTGRQTLPGTYTGTLHIRAIVQ
jgi:hypothetical protein